MPADRTELERRLAVATPADTVRGMIFNGMLDAVRGARGDEGVRQCLAGSPPRKFIDFFSYPVADYLRLAWSAVDLLEAPLGSTELAFFRLGENAVRNFLVSAVGKTLLAIISTDVRRALGNAPAAYKTTVSYGEREVRWHAPRHGEMIFNQDFLVPSFHAGVVETGLATIGKHPVRVRARSLGFMTHALDVSWD